MAGIAPPPALRFVPERERGNDPWHAISSTVQMTETTRIRRKLVAILSADVQGYARLMGADEEGTLRTLTIYREAMADLIQQDRGRVIDTPGDALLAEFESAVDALHAAVEIQRELAQRNRELPAERRMEYRIGVNLGDVMVDGDAIYGDGVNIAARLEALAEPGGISISGPVYDQVRNRLGVTFNYLGERSARNMAEPVRVYQVLLVPGRAAPAATRALAFRCTRTRRSVLGLMVLLVVGAATLAVWKLWLHPSPSPADVASREKMAFPLPDKPSIAVLPFVNMSDDREQEYFSDGITEDIITSLSKIQHLFVIARNSTFTYKGRAVKVKQVSEELGVRYVLEGSVRKTGDRVRITAQLIDAMTDHHLWAEKYDRDLRQIFALQDEITLKIMTALQVKLTVGEAANVWARGTNNLEAFIKCIQATANLTIPTREGVAKGRKLAEEALVLDPKYPRAYFALAQTHLLDILLGTTESSEPSLSQALELTKKAIALSDSEPDAHSLLGYVYTVMRQHDKAVEEAEKAVVLNPNSSGNLLRLGFVLLNTGRAEEAIPVLQAAKRLSPAVTIQGYFVDLTTAYRLTGRYKEAIEVAKQGIHHVPDNMVLHVQLAAAYSMAGHEKEARAAASEVLKINPKFMLAWYATTLYFKNQTDIDRTLEALRKAGLQ